MSDISVIIVSWNACEYLKKCLISIADTGGSTVREVIVVDNNSTDGSAEMVEADFPKVMLIRSRENLGFARANNIGISKASGRWLALVNSDVVVHADCFERLVETLDNQPKVGLVGPKIFGGDGYIQRSCRRLPTIWTILCRSLALDKLISNNPVVFDGKRSQWDHDSQANVEVLSGCFWMARRSAVEGVGGLDERFFFYAEDVDWCKRFWDKGWRVTFVPDATAIHFGGASSGNAPLRYSVQMLRANLEYWRKHRGIFGLMAYYFLSLAHHVIRFMSRGVRLAFGNDPSGETTYKFKRSLTCLRWLLTSKDA